MSLYDEGPHDRWRGHLLGGMIMGTRKDENIHDKIKDVIDKLVEQGFAPLPDWKDALRRYLREIAKQGD